MKYSVIDVHELRLTVFHFPSLSYALMLMPTAEGYDEYGSERWTQDIEKKIGHLQKALKMTKEDSPTPVFPDGIPVTIPEHMKKGSSVK